MEGGGGTFASLGVRAGARYAEVVAILGIALNMLGSPVASTTAVSALGAAPTWLGEGGLCVDLARALRGDFALLVVSLVCDVWTRRAPLPGAAARHRATHNIPTTPAADGMSDSCFGIVRSPFTVFALEPCSLI